MNIRRLLFAASLCVATPALAQEEDAPIQDNSFLIEEAYNQEAGVVQHINTFSRARGGAWAYSFTQEWPFPGQRHQVSFTLPVERVGEGAAWETGMGDLLLNYRYQLLGIGGSRLAVAPRLSLVLPTGDEERGLGGGGAGVQANLPVSYVLGDRLVAHSNAGLTWTPSARDAMGAEAATTSVNLGQSVVWLAHPRVNLLVEAAWSQDEAVAGDDATATSRSFFVSPGVRGAINVRGGLQIVPGIAVPIGVGPSDGERAVFLYLSLEHPFRKQR